MHQFSSHNRNTAMKLDSGGVDWFIPNDRDKRELVPATEINRWLGFSLHRGDSKGNDLYKTARKCRNP